MEEKLKLNAAQEKFFKNIVEHLDRSPEEVKRALNVNRQQRKQYLKEQEKKIRAVKNLTPIQISIMKEVVDKEKEKMEQWVANNTMSFYSSVNSVLYSDFNFSGEQTKSMWDKVEVLLDEDREVRKELSKISEEEWKKMENQVNEFIKKLLSEGKKQKEIIEELKKNFPKLSSAMRVNAFKEVKECWNEEKKLDGKSHKKIIVDEFEERQVKADEEINKIKEEEKQDMGFEKVSMSGVIKMDKEGIKIKVPSIIDRLKEQLNMKNKEEEKETEELKELEKSIAAKKEKINKIQEDIARIEEASAILEPVNI
ncbi:hypothetical protein P5F41_15120 [Clostridium perfringens]|nr:hypothetical protein [Clostridium perfringens]